MRSQRIKIGIVTGLNAGRLPVRMFYGIQWYTPGLQAKGSKPAATAAGAGGSCARAPIIREFVVRSKT
jgi:hypothetical protein